MRGVHPFRWDGLAFVPLRRQYLQDLEPGRVYTLVEFHDRSVPTHNHFFAVIHAAWQTLPEDIAADFPTPTHLRKYCLIRAGYCEMRHYLGKSKREAQRFAAFTRAHADEYTEIEVLDRSVVIRIATSQSVPAMNSKEFQACKEAVFVELGKILGVDPTELAKETQA